MLPIQRAQFAAQMRSYLRINEQLKRSLDDEAMEQFAEESANQQANLHFNFDLARMNQQSDFLQYSTMQHYQQMEQTIWERFSYDSQLWQVSTSALTFEEPPPFGLNLLSPETFASNAVGDARLIEETAEEYNSAPLFAPEEDNTEISNFQVNEVTIESSSLRSFSEEFAVDDILICISDADSNGSIVFESDCAEQE